MAQLSGIESKIFATGEFPLESGQSLPALQLAYETYGELAPGRDNAILVVHGYTSSHHAAGRYAPGKSARGVRPDAVGWYDALIGPGKAVDTDRYFVISVNALGSAHGSTGPNSTDPRTEKPYGPTFPDITMRDMVAAEKQLVDSLGIESLVAVVGPSMGGFQSFQWAASYPGFMKGIAAAVTAPRSPTGLGQLEPLQRRLSADPNWNDGWYYDNGGIGATLQKMRFETLMNYGMNEILAQAIPDPADREAAIRADAEAWAQVYDGHSLMVLRRAIGTFDITDDYAALKSTKVLYVQSPSDTVFDIAQSPGYVADMRAAGVDITYVELPTDKGHMASHADAALWAPILGAFLTRLE
ncbi:homoserine O-acetyltransferase [Antricoccus suffuscus]|uniref:Probable acyltransferase n=1 Tax=Antricoccus suffuscus TaxID=1629062 RepID=A0A2T0ZFS4_9ACTN|nr:alpha/beta fold hydrolase [Antricoccus suffuscus]PRZ35205.1 homoserine O-acetyltransferase [Antricoccus suffuscus]